MSHARREQMKVGQVWQHTNGTQGLVAGTWNEGGQRWALIEDEDPYWTTVAPVRTIRDSIERIV